MKVESKSLRYILIPAERPGSEWHSVYADAYRCWQKVWSKTFLELDGNSKVFSDDFVRQTEIGAILVEDRVAALGFFHEIDFQYPTARHDSYFRVWPEHAIQKLIEDGPRVIVGSNITVDPDYRGEIGIGVHLKDLILGLMVKTLLNRQVDVMTGTMRCNRGMHSAAYHFGASPIESGIVHHGVEVDLVAFYRRRLLKPGALTPNLMIERLWGNRSELGIGSTVETRKVG